MTHYDVAKKLIGPVIPQGESNGDIKRLENLKAMTELVTALVEDIRIVATRRDSSEHSVMEAGEYAYNYLKGELGIVD